VKAERIGLSAVASSCQLQGESNSVCQCRHWQCFPLCLQVAGFTTNK